MMTRTRISFFSLALLLASTSLAQASTFTDALEATYRNNPTIKAERERQKATDEGVAQALSGFRPTLGLGYERGEQNIKVGGAENDGSYENQTLNFNQPLFRGGATINSYQAAKQRVRSGQFTLSGIEQQVLLNAIAAYMDVVAASSILELSRNNEDVLKQQLKASQDRFEVGEVTRTDVAQSEARLSNATTDVIAAEGQLISALAVFERVIGYKPEGALAVPDQFPPLPANLEEALAQARNSNPQLLASIHAAKSAKFDARTDVGQILPQVALIGSMSRQSGINSFGSDQDYDQDTLGVRVSIPLYQSGAEYARVRESKSIARQRKHQAMDEQLVIEQEVTQAWEGLETSISTIKARDDQIKAAQVALDGVRQEQEYGARTVLDVLDAEQELFSARTNLVRAQRDRVVAAYNLALTLGDLTPKHLALQVDQYDPNEHYEDTKWKFIGF
jgi:TolC family type I secretion outer membrane protein